MQVFLPSLNGTGVNPGLGWPLPVPAAISVPGLLQPDPFHGVSLERVRDNQTGKPRKVRAMDIGEDLRTLLDIKAAEPPEPAFAAVTAVTPAVGAVALARPPAIVPLDDRQRAALRAYPPEKTLTQYVALWHSQMIRSLPRRAQALAEWRAAVMRDMLAAGVDRPTRQRLSAAFDAMDQASEQLERRRAKAISQLTTHGTVERMRQAGVSATAVGAALDRRSNRALDYLQSEALQGRPIFALVPTQQLLLDGAIRDAQEERRNWLAENGDRAPTDLANAMPRPAPARTGHGQPAFVPPIYPMTRLEIERARSHALAELQRFEAAATSHLPQLTGEAVDAARLSMGLIQFASMDDLLKTFPCVSISAPRQTEQLHRVLPHTLLATGSENISPPRNAVLTTVRKAYLNQTEVALGRSDADPTVVRYSTDLHYWTAANVYTDDVVEAEKRGMWSRIFNNAFRLSFGVSADLQELPPPPAE